MAHYSQCKHFIFCSLHQRLNSIMADKLIRSVINIHRVIVRSTSTISALKILYNLIFNIYCTFIPFHVPHPCSINDRLEHQKMLTYIQVHLYYTLPPTIILYLLIRPLLTSFDKIKILTLCILAVTYTTPWDNYIIYHQAWWYRKDAVIGTIGYVPIEEYIFFIVQTIFTSLWTICCSRWTLNALYLRYSKSLKFRCIKYVGIVLMAIAILWGWFNAIPATKSFYLASIIWWTLLVFVILWYIGSSYIVQRYKQILFSALIPSIYLCYVDLIALRARVWHINERTSLEIFLVHQLPIEEVIFFVITNFMVVMGAAGFDKSKAIIDTYFKEPLQQNLEFKGYLCSIKTLATAAICQEHKVESTAIDDLATCIDILNEGSKTFSLAANCFPNGNFILFFQIQLLTESYCSRSVTKFLFLVTNG